MEVTIVQAASYPIMHSGCTYEPEAKSLRVYGLNEWVGIEGMHRAVPVN